jgi:hypothetical protein
VPRQKLVTEDILDQIKSWVDEGLSPDAIADKIGCSSGTLRVRCSQHRISLRRKKNGITQDRSEPPETTVALWVPQKILSAIQGRAAMKGISGPALAAMLLKTIAEDDLYEAVLDSH